MHIMEALSPNLLARNVLLYPELKSLLEVIGAFVLKCKIRDHNLRRATRYIHYFWCISLPSILHVSFHTLMTYCRAGEHPLLKIK